MHALSRKRIRDTFTGYLFILPGIIGFLTFVAYPLIATLFFSQTQWSGIGTPKYIGMKNFVYMFTQDPSFWPSVKATFLFVILTTPSTLILGLALAVLLNKPIWGIKVFRTLYYLPVVLPSIAVLTLWVFIYQPQFGLANSLLRMFGLGGVDWLGSDSTALISLVIIALWAVGSSMVIFLGGLQSVPVDLYEAAEVDGASKWKSFWRITLPMITPILFLQLITGMIGSFQAFNQAQIMTKGGPDFTTNFLSFSIYNSAFGDQQFGYATAKTLVLFVIILIFTAVTYRFTSKGVYYENEEFK